MTVLARSISALHGVNFMQVSDICISPEDSPNLPQAVYKSIMTVLARNISALHGVNVMQDSDICISLEDSPNLPLHTNFGNSKTYAQEAIKHSIDSRALGKGKKKGKFKNCYSA